MRATATLSIPRSIAMYGGEERRPDGLAEASPRRREYLPFLTWPFFLSDIFKSTDAFAGAATLDEQLGVQKDAPSEQPLTSPAPTAEEPVWRDWSTPATASTETVPLQPVPLNDAPDSSQFPGSSVLAGRSSHGATPDGGGGGGVAHAATSGEHPHTTEHADTGVLDHDGSGIVLQTGPIELNLQANLPDLQVSLDVGPVSLEIATGKAVEGLVDTIVDVVPQAVTDPLEQLATTAVSTVEQIGGVARGLLGDAVGTSGLLNFASGNEAEQAPAYMPHGHYTDYDVALRNEHIADTTGGDGLSSGAEQAAISLPLVSIPLDGTLSDVHPALHQLEEHTARGPAETIL